MARKKGIIALEEAADSRENAIVLGVEVKRKFEDLIPHRVDSNTVILIHSRKDPEDQISRFIAKLERDRKNY